MVLTTEQRQLLEGDPERAQRNLPLLGWGSVGDSCPDHFVERILEIRQALVEKRSVPAPSRNYVAGAEQRSLASRAFGFAKRIFRSEDSELRDRLAKQARRISADAIIARSNEILLQEAIDQNESPEGFRRRLAAIDLRAGFALGVEAASEDGGQVSEGGTPTLRCPGQTLTASKSDHEKAAIAHNVRAYRSGTSKEAAIRHLDASTRHRQAAENLTQEYASKALLACKRSWENPDDEDDDKDEYEN